MEKTHSPVACDSAMFFCVPKSVHSRRMTRAPRCSACCTVSSLLPQSITMRSSQNAIESRHAPIFADSFLVIVMALSFGTALPRIDASCRGRSLNRSNVADSLAPAMSSRFHRSTRAFDQPAARMTRQQLDQDDLDAVRLHQLASDHIF